VATYTNQERIARKLIGRLTINPDISTLPVQSIAGYGPSVTGQVVQPELLTDTIREKESYVTLVLAQFYEVPLKLTSEITQDILGEIVDGLVISTLLQIHYESSVSPISGSQDLGNAASDMRRQAELMLAAVSASSNVFQSAQPAPIPNMLGGIELQPLVLPGEIILTRAQRPDIITRNYTVSAKNDRAANYRKEFSFDGEKPSCCGMRF
jgi:hypothetical protein